MIELTKHQVDSGMRVFTSLPDGNDWMMKRRKFLTSSGLALTGMAMWNAPNFTGAAPSERADYRIQTLVLDQETKIHAIPSGTVSIKKAHYAFEHPVAMRFPCILLDWRWTQPLPIWTWLIEHPQGFFLIDTGENVRVHEPNYFGDDGVSRFINRRILRISIREEQQVVNQIQELGLDPSKIDAVVLTHLHLDHTDGLRFFPHSEVLVSKTEWERPYGAAQSTFPKGFAPRTLSYSRDDCPFGRSHLLAENLWIVPTPGHTLGHQSVVFQHGNRYFMFAGDVSFSDGQLLAGQLGGITLDWKQGRQTQERVLAFARSVNLIYLPSHDPSAGERLVNQTPLLIG